MQCVAVHSLVPVRRRTEHGAGRRVAMPCTHSLVGSSCGMSSRRAVSSDVSHMARCVELCHAVGSRAAQPCVAWCRAVAYSVVIGAVQCRTVYCGIAHNGGVQCIVVLSCRVAWHRVKCCRAVPCRAVQCRIVTYRLAVPVQPQHRRSVQCRVVSWDIVPASCGAVPCLCLWCAIACRALWHPPACIP